MDNQYLGANIFWVKRGPVAGALSGILGLFYPEWRKRKWKPWHVGIIVDITQDDHVITCEAVGKGISYAEYDSIEDMGECLIVNWLWEAKQLEPLYIDSVWASRKHKIDIWVERHIGLKYDAFGYLWTIFGGISMKVFKKPWRVVNLPKFCWEVMCEFDRYMGVQLQPAEEPTLINRMLDIALKDPTRILKWPNLDMRDRNLHFVMPNLTKGTFSGDTSMTSGDC